MWRGPVSSRVGVAPLILSQLWFVEHLSRQVRDGHKDMCCVPRQVVAILTLHYSLVTNEMTEAELHVYGTTSKETMRGAPRMVLEFARLRGLQPL